MTWSTTEIVKKMRRFNGVWIDLAAVSAVALKDSGSALVYLVGGQILTVPLTKEQTVDTLVEALFTKISTEA